MGTNVRPPFGPFAIAIPASDIYAGGFVAVALPKSAIGLIQSAIEGLKYVDSWTGSDEARNLSAIQFEDIIALLMETSQLPGEPPSVINDIINQFCGCEDCEDDEMGCTLPYGSIKMIDGVLSYKTCDGWVAVDGWDTGVVVDPPPPDDPASEDDGYGCNKAAGVAEVFTPDILLMTEAIAGLSYRLMAQGVRLALPQYNISYARSKAIADAFVGSVAPLLAMVQDADFEERLKCTWHSAMLDTSTMTEDEFGAMLALTNSGFTPTEVAFINATANALGYSVFAWWAGAFHDQVADCECPDETPYTGLVTFQDDRTIILESQGASLDVATKEAPNIMYFEVKGGQNGNFQEVHWDEELWASGDIQEMEWHFPLESADVEGYYPAISWSDENPTPRAIYFQPDNQGPAADELVNWPIPGSQIVILKWDVPTDIDGSQVDIGIKMNPQNQSTFVQTYKFRAVITYAGPLR